VFLQRWTRLGQHRDNQLEKLLLLGEPEAVVAVAGAPKLTLETARRVWWLMPEADIARRMLEKEAVAASDLGRTIAAHLVEYLPFETEPLAAIQTVRLLLQPGLMSDDTRLHIWKRGNHRNAYRLGFLEANPHNLPEQLPARADCVAAREKLATLAAGGNGPASLLARLLDGPGQTFLAVSEELLLHPLDKYTVAQLLDVIGNYCADGIEARAAGQGRPVSGFADGIEARAAGQGAPDEAFAAVLAAAPELQPETAAMRALALVNESLATEIFAKTTATGTLLKRKLEPITAPLLRHYAVLRGAARQGG
jgi:hypothetical protein